MQNSQENTCAEVSFEQSCRPTVCNFIKKETLAQIFPCVIFEIFQISFFAEYPRETPITNTNHGHNLGKRNSKDSQEKISAFVYIKLTVNKRFPFNAWYQLKGDTYLKKNLYLRCAC